jgi:hypothetical protein
MTKEVGPPAPDWWKRSVNRVAEVQFFLRFQLRNVLESQGLADTEDVRRFVGDSKNWLEYWDSQFGQQFFDMATLVRLATTVETLLRDYYRICRGHPSLSGLVHRRDRGVFQRVFPWSQPNVIDLYTADLEIDLLENPELRRIQELMANRHLYGHSSGLITDEYLDNWKRLTDEDLRKDPKLGSYPDKDVYWFRPLEDLNAYVEDVRRFFRWFPTSANGASGQAGF